MKKGWVIFLLVTGIIATGCAKNKTTTDKKAFYQQNSSTTGTTEDVEASSESYGSDAEQSEAEETQASADAKIEVIKTANGEFKLSVPVGWKKAKANELSNSADIELKEENDTSYYIVLSEQKADFSSFSTYKESIDLSELGEIREEVTIPIEYNGFKGERRTFIAKKDNVDVYYIYDLIEGKNYYVQCISWTPNDQKEFNEKQMLDVMNSLMEL